MVSKPKQKTFQKDPDITEQVHKILKLGNRARIGINEFREINCLPTKERFEQCVFVNIFKIFNNAYL